MTYENDVTQPYPPHFDPKPLPPLVVVAGVRLNFMMYGHQSPAILNTALDRDDIQGLLTRQPLNPAVVASLLFGHVLTAVPHRPVDRADEMGDGLYAPHNDTHVQLDCLYYPTELQHDVGMLDYGTCAVVVDGGVAFLYAVNLSTYRPLRPLLIAIPPEPHMGTRMQFIRPLRLPFMQNAINDVDALQHPAQLGTYDASMDDEFDVYSLATAASDMSYTRMEPPDTAAGTIYALVKLPVNGPAHVQPAPGLSNQYMATLEPIPNELLPKSGHVHDDPYYLMHAGDYELILLYAARDMELGSPNPDSLRAFLSVQTAKPATIFIGNHSDHNPVFAPDGFQLPALADFAFTAELYGTLFDPFPELAYAWFDTPSLGRPQPVGYNNMAPFPLWGGYMYMGTNFGEHGCRMVLDDEPRMRPAGGTSDFVDECDDGGTGTDLLVADSKPCMISPAEQACYITTLTWDLNFT